MSVRVEYHQAPPSYYMMHSEMVSMKVAGVEQTDVLQCVSNAWNDAKGVGWYKHLLRMPRKPPQRPCPSPGASWRSGSRCDVHPVFLWNLGVGPGLRSALRK